MPTAPAAGARCASHSDRAAVDLCRRCGAFVCGDCIELSGSDVYCESCFARVGVAQKASRQAVAALLLGILGLNCGFVWGVIGLVLANRELKLIESGQAPLAGRSFASGARLLGWINVVALVLGALVAANYLLRGGP